MGLKKSFQFLAGRKDMEAFFIYTKEDGTIADTATKIEWTKEGGIPILKERSPKDGTWYALKEFYDCIQNKKLPSSNVYTGAKTAIIVKLANDSMYQNVISKWKPEYNVVQKTI